MYQILVALTVAAHFLFIGYVVAGGLLALRWRRTIGLHMVAVSWGVASAAGHVGCPLTGLERWARYRAGIPPLTSKGFIAHYITGVFYPANWATAVNIVVAVVVAMSWIGYVWLGRHRDVWAARSEGSISATGEL